jgi:peroxiredoxin
LKQKLLIYFCNSSKHKTPLRVKMNIVPPGYLIFLAITFFAVGCKDSNNGKTRDGDLTISGKIGDSQSSILILEELTPVDVIALDTINIDNKGFFTHSLFMESAGFYRLRNVEGQFITLAAEPGEKIYITADLNNFRQSYEVAGSDGSKIIWNLNKHLNDGLAITDSLRAIYREHRNDPEFLQIRQSLKEQYRNTLDNQKNYVLQVIDTNPNSLVSILALYQFFEDKQLLDEREHFQYFEKLSKSLCASYPHNKHVINLKKRVSDLRRDEEQRIQNEINLATGKEAPEITLSDPDGNPVSLSSLRGNVVLIDFWAAWCPPCREANALLRQLYQKHQGDGFEIYAISLDRTREQWINAIKKDNITWTQVSDLRFMNSPVVNLYSVVEVPHYVLIDRDGKIITRDFNINELEDLLKENL